MSAPTPTEIFAEEIAESNDPTLLALAMLEAVAGHMQDLRDDDPVSEDEGLTTREINVIYHDVNLAIATLREMYRRIGKEL